MLFEFPSYESPITYLSQTSVIDVVAIGLNDGRIIIQNIRTGFVLKSFQQEGAVTGISFRTDTGAPQSMMASSNNDGSVCLWDLDNSKLIFKMVDAHIGSVHTAIFLSSQPVLVTAGEDNSIKVFDNYFFFSCLLTILFVLAMDF